MVLACDGFMVTAYPVALPFNSGGVILGVIFLHEQLSWQLAVGAALIISSIAVVNSRKK